MSEFGTESGTAEGEDQDLPPVNSMTLDEIEEDLDYLFHAHVGQTVILLWIAAAATAILLLTLSEATIGTAVIAFAAWFVSLVVTFVMVKLAAFRLTAKAPASNFKYQYVWIFSAIFHGPQGQVLAKMPHERIREMLQRRCELLELQNLSGYSPVTALSAQKWRMLGRILFEKLPYGLARIIQSYYVLLLLVMVLMGIVGIAQLIIFIRNELILQ